jgi:molecular chaperone DnaK
MIDNLNKTLSEAGDKIAEEDKKVVEDAIAKAKTALDSNDNDQIKSAFDELQKDVAPVISKLYQQAQGSAQGQTNPGDDDTEFSQHK